eukprot:308883_1
MFLIIALWLISLIHAISSSTPSWESFTDLGSLQCNQSKTGTAEDGVVFSVTIPSGHSNFKISTCHTDHQDDGSLSACKTSDMNDCLSSDPEPDSCGCNNREMVSASIGTGINEAATDAHYTFVYYSNSSGQFQYSFSMECGDTFIPDTCVDYNPGYSTTGSFMTTSVCDSDWDSKWIYHCVGFPSVCVLSWNMCDGNPQCPQEDDEDRAVCEPFWDTTTTSPPTTECGPIECGQSYTGTTTDAPLSFLFTIPEDEPQFKINICHIENEGEGWFEFCKTDDSYECLFVYIDDSCGCSHRPVLTATIGNGLGEAEPGANYTFTYEPYFSGNYKFSVECGATFTPGTCGESTATSPPSSQSYYTTTTAGWVWTTQWRRRNLLSSSTTPQSACPQDPTAHPTKSPFTPTAGPTKSPFTPTAGPTKSPFT